MQYRFINSIDDVVAKEWDALASDDYPFLQHSFLQLLESSGSVSVERGWQPQHLLLEEQGELIAAMPLYIKSHSYGEYVFDQRWANAYQHHGLPYYPKLVCAVPFTPATGPRVLCHSAGTAHLVKTIQAALQKQCESLHASGWHLLFPDNDMLADWQREGAALRLGCQYHWHNRQYGSMDDFLATFTARKRKELKRERRRVAEQGITLQRLTGDSITREAWEAFYRFYVHTNLKYNGHGGYLTPQFFALLHETMRDQLLLVMAYNDQGNAIAGALNIISASTLYGRYWGGVQDVECLHFETCYYQGIEFCIERNIARFDPGAQGEHKIARGFEPVLTHSLHWLAHEGFHEAVTAFVREEADAVRHYQQQAAEGLPFKQNG